MSAALTKVEMRTLVTLFDLMSAPMAYRLYTSLTAREQKILFALEIKLQKQMKAKPSASDAYQKKEK